MKSLKKHWRIWYSLFLAVCCVLTIAWYAWHQERHFRNLHAVKPGVLYRSGQMTREGLLRTLHELNIGTLVNLRGLPLTQPTSPGGEGGTREEWEAELCEKNFVTFVSVPLGSPEHSQKIAPQVSQRIIDHAVNQFLDILSNPEEYPRPILVHCLGGTHRTGVMAALFRIEEEGWSKERALAEMQLLGYRDFTSPDPLRDYIVNWVPTHERKDGTARK